MSRGVSKATRLLVQVIEDTLNHAAGDLTPLLDDPEFVPGGRETAA
jgi:hypothetical protein